MCRFIWHWPANIWDIFLPEKWFKLCLSMEVGFLLLRKTLSVFVTIATLRRFRFETGIRINRYSMETGFRNTEILLSSLIARFGR